MRTVEDIQRERGLDVREVDWDKEADLRGCGFNPSEDGAKEYECGLPARWHARVSSERVHTGLTLISCEDHLGVIMTAYVDAILGLHEFTAPCGLAGWWVEMEDDCGSTCLTEEDGIRMGYLVLAPVIEIGENQSHGQGHQGARTRPDAG